MPGINTKRRTILLVEDDPDIRDMVQHVLENDGYRVLTAENGSDGLEIGRKNPATSLILLDLEMPVLNGRSFLDVAATDPVLSTMPILVASSTAEAANTKGATGFIRKPVDPKVLLNLVDLYSK